MRDYQVAGRLYHMHDFYGAHTGRPTGSGPQVLNTPRSEEADLWATTLSENPCAFYVMSRPTERLKESIRGTIMATKGNTLVGWDIAQGEARGTGWLAGDEKFLNLFATSDPYCTYGKELFGHVITKEEHPEKRQASKASVLAFGFAGGIGAGQRVGENYKMDFSELARVTLPSATPHEFVLGNVNYEYYMGKMPLKPLPEDQAVAVDILKQRFRRDFTRIVEYWDGLEGAFLAGGTAGRITIEKFASGLRLMTLPSGRQLPYHGVHIDRSGNYSYQGRHGRMSIWKGTLIENAAQATLEDIANWYRKRVNKIAGIVHQCYDEATSETPKTEGERVLAALKTLTKNFRPDFTDGFPLGFTYWIGERYGK
jgi:hypothetical protein